MKKALVAFVGIACALALTVSAAESKKKGKMTEEQKTLMKSMVEKYDANKDGKLDKEERAKMTTEEKEKYQKAFPHQKKKKSE